MSLNRKITRRDFIEKAAFGTGGLTFANSFNQQSTNTSVCSENLLVNLIEHAARSGITEACRPWSPNETIMPHCRIHKNSDEPEFIVESNGSIGCHGGWELTGNNIRPGETYRFRVNAQLANIPRPVENVSVEIYFFGKKERHLDWEFIEVKQSHREYIEFEHCITAPEGTNRAIIRLLLRWTGHGTIKFRNLELKRTDLKKRPVVKAAVGAGLKGHKTIESNIGMCLDVVKEAARGGAQLVLLPEVITTAGVSGGVWKNARPIPGKETDAFSSCAREHRINIAFSMFEANGDLVHNTGLVFGPDGDILLKYRKLQLAVGERWDGITPGDSLPVAKLPIGCVGMQICYDNVHPEGIRTLAWNGADIVLLPIMGDPRCEVSGKGWVREKWELVMRMRALDNHTWFLVARNRGEASCIINPAGDIIASMKKDEYLIFAELDLNFRNWSSIGSNFRNRYWRERRPSAFSQLCTTDFRIG